MIQHLACIMDGNRRWAVGKGLLGFMGHKNGVQAARQAIEFCLEKNIPHLSLYAFSLENFNRTQQEQSYLFDLMEHEGLKFLTDLTAQQVRVRFVGERLLFPKRVKRVIEKIERETVACTALNLNILFCYGSRQEIIAGVRAIAHKIRTGEITEDNITSELFEQHLWTYGTPAPDLIIRSGRVKRLSNFLLYQAAYTELYFLDCLWPEVTKEHLQGAMDFFNNCQRNLGA